LGAVVRSRVDKLGEKRSQLLVSMADYWEAVVDLIQRQEHGGSKESEALTWQDGRRVAFHTAAVMFEFATTLDENS
jgi:hypothetical protein